MVNDAILRAWNVGCEQRRQTISILVFHTYIALFIAGDVVDDDDHSNIECDARAAVDDVNVHALADYDKMTRLNFSTDTRKPHVFYTWTEKQTKSNYPMAFILILKPPSNTRSNNT
jgi:hypothetical protein